MVTDQNKYPVRIRENCGYLLRERSCIPERCTILRVNSGHRIKWITGGRNKLKLLCRHRRFALLCRRLFLFGNVSFPLPRRLRKQPGRCEIGRVSYNRFAVCLHLSKEQPQNIPFRRRAVPFLTRRSSPASKQRVYHVTGHRHLHTRGFFFDFAHTIYIHIINIVNMC